jgi:endonuclease YncB( thermonuclease family)
MKLIALFISLFLSLYANAEALNAIQFPDATVSRITSVYDGDTFRADIAGYPKIVGYRMAIRINGIDTPEMKGHCESEKQKAIKAKQLTASMLKNGHVIELKNIKRGKYFRLLADVYVDGQSISESLIDAGLAVEYHGKTKIDWCAL